MRLSRPLVLASAALLASCTSLPSGDGYENVPIERGDGPGAMALFPVLEAEAEANDNVFISPLSIELAFGLLHAGARGETRAQIEQILPPPEDPLGFEVEGNDVTVAVSNALFLDDSFRFRPEYLRATERVYEAQAIGVDFAAKQQSVDTINAWADEATQGMIPKVISPPAITDDMVALLANALYFEALWQTKLDQSSNHPFLFGDGSREPFKFVGESFATPYATLGDWEAVRLPYRGKRFVMDVIMPDEQRVMTQAPALDFLSRMKSALDAADARLVKVEIPQFEIDFGQSLKQPLVDMGLDLPFSRSADLTGIAEPGQQPIKVGDVQHITKLQVYDEGTKAAAITTISIVVTGARMEPKGAIPFRADRPFIVVIRDLKRDAVLFIGRISDPQPFEPEVDEGAF